MKDVAPVTQREIRVGLIGAAINVGEVYAHLLRDIQAGTYNNPGFEHTLHNARLMEAVRHAADQGVRQKVRALKPGPEPTAPAAPAA
jgi:predicted dehydrogenase